MACCNFLNNIRTYVPTYSAPLSSPSLTEVSVRGPHSTLAQRSVPDQRVEYVDLVAARTAIQPGQSGGVAFPSAGFQSCPRRSSYSRIALILGYGPALFKVRTGVISGSWGSDGSSGRRGDRARAWHPAARRLGLWMGHPMRPVIRRDRMGGPSCPPTTSADWSRSPRRRTT